MAPLVPEVGQAIMTAHTAKTQLQTAVLSLDEKQRADAMGTLQSVAAGADPNLIGDQLDSWVTKNPQMAGTVQNVKANLLPHIINAPPAQRAQMANSMAALLQPGQQVQTQPAAASVNNGQSTLSGTTAPPNAGGGFTPQTAVQNQPGPTTPVMRNGVPGILGPTGPQTPASAATIQTGPALGQEAGVTGPVATNNAHYAGVQAGAAAAPTRIGVLQNIKALAPDAVTGDAPALKTIVSKLAGYVGWTGSTQTPTDVMAKEAALLASQGGQTDLARTLNEAATPNGHMTQAAIQQTADQLIGQEKAKQAAGQYFTGTPTNDPLYSRKMQLWSQNGDPQAFEYAAKSPADQATMKSTMVKAGTWGALRQHMIQLHNMGLDPQ